MPGIVIGQDDEMRTVLTKDNNYLAMWKKKYNS